MKKLLYSLIFLFCSNLLIAQISTKVPEVITPSPNAAAIGKFTETPINYNTGVPQISLPIFNWEKNNLKL